MKKTNQKAESRKQKSSKRLATAAQDYAALSLFIKRAEEKLAAAAELLRRHCPAGEFRVFGQHLVHVSRIVKHRVPAYIAPEQLRLSVRKLGQ